MNLTRIFGGGAAVPGPGPVWSHQHQGLDYDGSSPPFHAGICSGFFHNLCSTITNCAYLLCCCWLIQDCCCGLRDYDPGPPPPPGPSYGTWAPGPPELQFNMPGPPGPPGGPFERPFY